MGLDIIIKSTGKAVGRWSYSGFNDFRKRLCNMLGRDLDSMQGFGGDMRFPKDDIKPLLDHSDCEGELKPTQKLEKRLREMVCAWPDNDYDKQQALRLADGMAEARRKHSVIDFC